MATSGAASGNKTAGNSSLNSIFGPVSNEYERLRKVLDEMLLAERNYVQNMEVLIDKFANPLRALARKGGVDMNMVGRIFANVEDLLNFHRLFYTQLQQQTTAAAYADTFLKFSDFFKMYTLYVNGYDRRCDCVDALRKNEKFAKVLADARKDRITQGNTLMAFLIMPVQRIPLYELLLQELMKAAEAVSSLKDKGSGHSGADLVGPAALSLLDVALSKVRDIAKYINENKRKAQDQSKLLDLQSKLSGAESLNLVAPGRHLIREGDLSKIGALSFRHTRRFFLFNDLLLWTTPALRLRGYLDLSPAQIIAPNVRLDPSIFSSPASKQYGSNPSHMKLLEGGFEIVHPRHNSLICYAANEEDRKAWVIDIATAIRLSQDKASDARNRNRLSIVDSENAFDDDLLRASAAAVAIGAPPFAKPSPAVEHAKNQAAPSSRVLSDSPNNIGVSMVAGPSRVLSDEDAAAAVAVLTGPMLRAGSAPQLLKEQGGAGSSSASEPTGRLVNEPAAAAPAKPRVNITSSKPVQTQPTPTSRGNRTPNSGNSSAMVSESERDSPPPPPPWTSQDQAPRTDSFVFTHAAHYDDGRSEVTTETDFDSNGMGATGFDPNAGRSYEKIFIAGKRRTNPASESWTARDDDGGNESAFSFAADATSRQGLINTLAKARQTFEYKAPPAGNDTSARDATPPLDDDDAEVQNILTDVVDTAVPLGLENHLMECTNMLQTISYADLVDDCGLADLHRFTPHIVIRKVLEAAAIVLGAEPVYPERGRKKGTPDFWASSISFIEKPHFLSNLVVHAEKRLKIPDHLMQELKFGYVTNPLLSPKHVYRSSYYAGVLWDWIRARYAYQARDEGLLPQKDDSTRSSRPALNLNAVIPASEHNSRSGSPRGNQKAFATEEHSPTSSGGASSTAATLKRLKDMYQRRQEQEALHSRAASAGPPRARSDRDLVAQDFEAPADSFARRAPAAQRKPPTAASSGQRKATSRMVDGHSKSSKKLRG